MLVVEILCNLEDVLFVADGIDRTVRADRCTALDRGFCFGGFLLRLLCLLAALHFVSQSGGKEIVVNRCIPRHVLQRFYVLVLIKFNYFRCHIV